MAVYFMQRASGGPIKIGCAYCPKLRAMQIRTKVQEPIEILGFIEDEEQITEFALHRRFARSALGGEWFVETPELVMFIAQHAEGVDNPQRIGWYRARNKKAA